MDQRRPGSAAGASLRARVRSAWKRLAGRGTYDQVSLTDEEIRRGAYADLLGGGAGAWERRGEYQRHLLGRLGLLPEHRLLEVGCGPARASVHLIEYLEPGHFVGMDYNESFIRAARHVTSERGLDARGPRFECVQDFALDLGGERVDWVLAFSVLNHCTPALRERCLDMLERVLAEHGTALVTHARWYDERLLDGRSLRLHRTIGPDDLDPDLLPRAWGWGEEQAQVFPILELTRT